MAIIVVEQHAKLALSLDAQRRRAGPRPRSCIDPTANALLRDPETLHRLVAVS